MASLHHRIAGRINAFARRQPLQQLIHMSRNLINGVSSFILSNFFYLFLLRISIGMGSTPSIARLFLVKSGRQFSVRAQGYGAVQALWCLGILWSPEHFSVGYQR